MDLPYLSVIELDILFVIKLDIYWSDRFYTASKVALET
jgi:hypothetical protein